MPLSGVYSREPMPDIADNGARRSAFWLHFVAAAAICRRLGLSPRDACRRERRVAAYRLPPICASVEQVEVAASLRRASLASLKDMSLISAIHCRHHEATPRFYDLRAVSFRADASRSCA